jgi:hypothetical protein
MRDGAIAGEYVVAQHAVTALRETLLAELGVDSHA